MVSQIDVLIVGAGPAGTAAAITARRRGLHVVVIDKAEFPRQKCCGDGLTAGALRHLEDLGLNPVSIPSWKSVAEVKVAGPDFQLRTFPLPSGQGTFAAAARRSELDAALVDLAIAEGADVHQGTAIESIEILDGHVLVCAGGQEFQATSVIAADGMWSPTRKMLGLDTKGYRGEWHGFRQYFSNVGPLAAKDLCVWFEPDILPGYVWSFPLANGTANVGFGILRGGKVTVQEMNTLWPDILQRPHIREVLGPDAVAEGPHRALPIPARLGDTQNAAHRVLFVGDAATATDPMTGEGIGQALETGIRAASAIADAGVDNPEAAAADYLGGLKAGMVKDHKLAGLLSRVLATKLGTLISLRVCDLTPWTRRNFARWLFEDYPRAIVLTPKRWDRKVFKRPGAFISK